MSKIFFAATHPRASSPLLNHSTHTTHPTPNRITRQPWRRTKKTAPPCPSTKVPSTSRPPLPPLPPTNNNAPRRTTIIRWPRPIPTPYSNTATSAGNDSNTSNGHRGPLPRVSTHEFGGPTLQQRLTRGGLTVDTDDPRRHYDSGTPAGDVGSDED